MIIDQNGEILSKKNETNNRHRWERWAINEWHCSKCDCIKIQVERQLSKYTLYGVTTETAPKCDNSKITVIKNSKKDERERIKQQQLSINWL